MGDPDAYVGQYEFQVPILVVTNRSPVRQPKQDEYLTLTFVSDGVGQAIAKAQAAAGAQDVQIVGGPTVIQQALRAGLVAELHLDVTPILLGEGLRFFDSYEAGQPALSLRDIERQGERAGLRFSIAR
ncbi:MAG: dihydrofolate reductase family protein [Thermomicrobiales bacterium]